MGVARSTKGRVRNTNGRGRNTNGRGQNIKDTWTKDTNKTRLIDATIINYYFQDLLNILLFQLLIKIQDN